MSSSVTLSLDSSSSIRNEPMCTLMFIDETGNVYLTTNTIRYIHRVCTHLIAIGCILFNVEQAVELWINWLL